MDALKYAHTDVSIASWWGPDTNLDRARLLMLMDKSIEMNSNIYWSIYYEDEHDDQPSPAKIREDLNYIKKWFSSHPAWAYIDGKPLIFVWNKSGCDVSRRWMEASNDEWYVVTKLFGGYQDCAVQPDHWHQYGVGDGALRYRGVSFTIAPGFWRADQSQPKKPRLSEEEFCQNVKEMSEFDANWKLVVSFNEAGEGTMIESSPAWESDSGYGYYLDCLNKFY